MEATKSKTTKSEVVEFEQIVTRGCGIDVHKKNLVATIKGVDLKEQTKTFSTFTEDLESLREWLKEHSITHVAMESTGVYWKPLYNVLEGNFEILLVNARHIKNVPGHKTDVKDSRWIAKLLLSGLLKGSYIPLKPIRELRDLTRYRQKVVQQIASDKNRIHRILEDANIKLSSVVSDLSGATASKIISDIISGIEDVEELLKHYHGKLKASKEELSRSLKGNISNHHRFMLKTIYKNIESKEEIITEIKKQIFIHLKENEFTMDVEALKSIPGVGEDAAVGIIAEIGNNNGSF